MHVFTIAATQPIGSHRVYFIAHYLLYTSVFFSFHILDFFFCISLGSPIGEKHMYVYRG